MSLKYFNPKITWERLFIRSGIRFTENEGTLNLKDEPAYNLDFIRKILESVGWATRLSACSFFKPQELINERDWLLAWEKNRSGAEAGYTGFADIELSIMDTHISGIVRWMNALGFITTISCEGHRLDKPCWIQLLDKNDEPKLANFIDELSDHEFIYKNSILSKVDLNRQGGVRRPLPYELLDLGECIFGTKINNYPNATNLRKASC